MYKDFYHEPKAEITPLKLMVAALTVILFFVLPAQIITFFQQNPNEWNRFKAQITNTQYIPEPTTGVVAGASAGRVAGTSTSNATVSGNNDNILVNIQESLSKINLSDESTRYSALGLGMVAISSIILVYLVATEKRGNANDSYENKYSNGWL